LVWHACVFRRIVARVLAIVAFGFIGFETRRRTIKEIKRAITMPVKAPGV